MKLAMYFYVYQELKFRILYKEFLQKSSLPKQNFNILAPFI